MSGECMFPFVSFCGSVALPSVFPHMLLQITRVCASVVALVALERFLTSVFPRVSLQITRCRARVVALVALERLLPRVSSHVSLQITR